MVFLVKKVGEDEGEHETKEAETKMMEEDLLVQQLIFRTETKFEDFTVNEPSLSLHSLAGVTTAWLKLEGTIQGRTVVILVDSGATHNFICEQLVAELKLLVENERRFTVVIRDGTHREGVGCCHTVATEIQGLSVEQSCFSFPIAGSKVILGMAWLETLGEVKVDWKKLRILVDEGGGHISCKETLRYAGRRFRRGF